VPRADATGFATLLFLVVTVPLWAGGFLALVAAGMRLGDLRRKAQESMDRIPVPAPAGAAGPNPPQAV